MREEQDGVELQADEERLVAIKRRAMLVATALVKEPFAERTVEALRAYMDEDADEGQELADRLRSLPEGVLRARITELQARATYIGELGGGKTRPPWSLGSAGEAEREAGA
ncbi:hypothetical protein OG453_44770 [Streptomyces sp. NBC_01381]|uniref:hypothetical protein n=1 Tax=Streptomyces sp. NBC_01381 TaxID=2903845 RepID=UPI002258B652|nr:hypothetical protein [Streptomyces sp. NBC_01381]MCX4673673.1 hypothetical protein [Streptomyces sp. NBC_01381]